MLSSMIDGRNKDICFCSWPILDEQSIDLCMVLLNFYPVVEMKVLDQVFILGNC